MNLELNPEKIYYVLLSIIAILTTCNLFGIAIDQFTDPAIGILRLIELVDFDEKGNIPTWYSSLSLLFSAFLSGYIASVRKNMNKDFWHWLGLSILFILLSIDETVSFHQLLFAMAKKFQDHVVIFSSLLLFYGSFVGGVLLIYGRFFLRLPYPFRVMFILSSCIYISGAIGVDTIVSSNYAFTDVDEFGYAVLYTVEELLEMIGIASFVYSLLFLIENPAFFKQSELSGESSLVNGQ